MYSRPDEQAHRLMCTRRGEEMVVRPSPSPCKPFKTRSTSTAVGSSKSKSTSKSKVNLKGQQRFAPREFELSEVSEEMLSSAVLHRERWRDDKSDQQLVASPLTF